MTEEFANKLVYLASPFSAFAAGPDAAFIDACTIAARLLAAGITTYSPIVYSHPIARYGDLDALDHDLWMRFDEAMLRRCDILMVAHMDGWEQSKGIAHEISYFERAQKDIWDLDPVDLTMSKRQRAKPSRERAYRTPEEIKADRDSWLAQGGGSWLAQGGG